MTPTFIAACIAFALPSLFGWWPTHAAFLRAVRERDEAQEWARRECEQAEKWQFSWEEHDSRAEELRAVRGQLAQITAERNRLNASLTSAAAERFAIEFAQMTAERDEAVKLAAVWREQHDGLQWSYRRQSVDLATLRAQLASVEAEHEARCQGWGTAFQQIRAELAEARAQRDDALARVSRKGQPRVERGRFGRVHA